MEGSVIEALDLSFFSFRPEFYFELALFHTHHHLLLKYMPPFVAFSFVGDIPLHPPPIALP